MKKLMRILPLIFLAGIAAAQETEIGQEQIKPIKFPKFSLTSEYSFGRYAKLLGEDGLATGINSRFGGALSFDVGLMKHFNAGAGFSSTVGNPYKQESIFMRFFMFAKPHISVSDQISLHTRLSGGLTIMLLNPVHLFHEVGPAGVRHRTEQVYGSQKYDLTGPGFHGGATIGVDYFPFSRFGVALEWGVRADIAYFKKSDFLDRLTGANTSKADAPASIKYLGIDMPLTLTLHIIL